MKVGELLRKRIRRITSYLQVTDTLPIMEFEKRPYGKMPNHVSYPASFSYMESLQFFIDNNNNSNNNNELIFVDGNILHKFS